MEDERSKEQRDYGCLEGDERDSNFHGGIARIGAEEKSRTMRLTLRRLSTASNYTQTVDYLEVSTIADRITTFLAPRKPITFSGGITLAFLGSLSKTSRQSDEPPTLCHRDFRRGGARRFSLRVRQRRHQWNGRCAQPGLSHFASRFRV